MKRFICLLATLLLSFGLAGATNQVDIDHSLGDTVWSGQAGSFDFFIENDIKLGGISFGFQFSGTAGLTWTDVDGFGLTRQMIVVVPGCRMTPTASVWDLGNFQANEYDLNQTLPDAVLIGGAALGGGMLAGPLQKMVEFHFTATAPPDEVRTICVDSFFVPPGGNFIFVDEFAASFTPGIMWLPGPKCFPVKVQPNMPPTFTNCPGSAIPMGHCAAGQVDLNATDGEGNPFTFSLVSTTGAGTPTVNSGSGLVTYTADPADVNNTIDVVVRVADAFGGTNCTVQFAIGNANPTITCGVAYNPVGFGNVITKTDINGADGDGCDVLTYSLVSAPIGDMAVNAANGDFTWTTTLADVGLHTVTVGVTDGYGPVVTCTFDVDVLLTEPYEVQIEKTHNTLQGHYETVDITLNAGSEAMGGFDFLIAYDASALSFTGAELGAYFVGCGWEYFTYRFGANGNCDGGCPSGLLRLVGLAETNNGPYHPDWDCIKAGADEVIVSLTFLVSNDRTFECMYAPIRFFWLDCGDNTISVASGDTLAISRYVIDFEDNHIEDYDYGFPGYVGAPDLCLEGDKTEPVRFIDFINGGIDIVCGDSIDARGDINLNGVPNEIADAVMFTNYFINGLGAFGGHIEGSIAASDVNVDGIALSIADLVYLIRVVVGDALPYPKAVPGAMMDVATQLSNDQMVVSYNASTEVGAALLVFNVEGNVGTPVLGNGAATMDVVYGVTGNELRVLVYNIGHNAIAAGENVLVTIPVEGTVTLASVEVADYNGGAMETSVRVLPSAFGLAQNYPNPFNPTTTIALNLPVESDYAISIYNVAGQVVRTINGHAAAGVENVIWDGTDNSNNSVASGIYFYKAVAGKFSDTKKMVLMK